MVDVECAFSPICNDLVVVVQSSHWLATPRSSQPCLNSEPLLLGLIMNLVDDARNGRNGGQPSLLLVDAGRRSDAIRLRLRLLFVSGKRLWRGLLPHTGVFEHIGPFPAGAGMAMLEVLTEMIGPEKLLRLVALAELVSLAHVLGTDIPVCGVRELLAAVATHVGCGRLDGRGMESSVHASQSLARPRVSTKM